MSSPSTTRNSKLVFVRAPAHKRRGTVDTEQDKGRLPDNIPGLGIGSLLPDIGVPVLRRGNDAVGVRSPVYGSNRFVVLFRGDLPCLTIAIQLLGQPGGRMHAEQSYHFSTGSALTYTRVDFAFAIMFR